ncbi:TetR/AcrR family transcriptional regulator [Glycomyces sp. MUSA5-2]|uniref:TetR/AcrR family transcriptional regulator n=1 Tax=Glycomyces sp. MUSA5-2 TaxID=2053002 RepID=UPI003008CCCA
MPRINAASVGEHRDQTMTRLLDAFEAALDSEGFAALTLAGVAARAGIARNTVYNYAKDKQGLLHIAVERALQVVEADLDGPTSAGASAEERLCSVIDRLMEGFTRGAPRLLVLQALQGASPVEVEDELPTAERLRERIAVVIRDGIEAGEFRPVADLTLTVAMMSGALEAAVRALGRGDRTTEAVTGEAKSLILHAIRA